MKTLNVTVNSVVEVQVVVEGDSVVLSQLDAGCWHEAGRGKLHRSSVGVLIEDCAARFGVLDEDYTEETYAAVEAAVERAGI